MPQNGDGKHYRTFGQAYRAGKEQKPANENSESEHEPKKGSLVHVKHHGGGKFSVKHEDGSVSKHESPEEMHAHLDEHFGVQDEPEGEQQDQDSDDYSEGGDHALKSILGTY